MNAMGTPAAAQRHKTQPMEAFLMRRPRPDFVLRAALAYACTQVGSGLLALGPAVGQAGWVGVPVIVLCGLCGAYTSYTLGWTIFRLQATATEGSQTIKEEVEESTSGSETDGSSTSSSSQEESPITKERTFQSYEDVSEQALGIFGRLISLLLQGLMLVGVCTIFLVLIGVNAAQLEEMYNVDWLSKRDVILVAAGLELFPCILVGTVKETFILTAIGALCSAICAVVVVVAAFTTSSNKLQSCLEMGETMQWPLFTDFKGLSLCWNTVVFSFGGINVLPTLLVDFHSRGVLARALVSFTWRSYLFIIFFYVIVAVCGFAVGGNAMASRKVDSNVLIGLQGCQDNHSGSPDWSLLVAYASITLHVVLAFPVPFHACAETLESVLGIRQKLLGASWGPGLLLRLPRLVLLAACTALAYSLPFFGALLNVVAAIAGQATVFILPILLSWAIQRQQKYKVRGYDWFLGTLCLIVGILGAVTGLYYGLNELVSAFKST